MHRASGPLKLKKENNQWRITEPLQDLADATAVDNLLNSLTTEKTQELVAEGEDAKNLTVYGLDNPVTKLIVHGENGFSREVEIGSVKSFDSQLYAKLDQKPQVWLVTGNWDLYLTKQIKELRDKHLMRNELLELDEIKASIQGKPSWDLKNNKTTWALASGGDSTIPVANNLVTSYHELLRDLQADDIVSEDKAKDQNRYGLQKPLATIVAIKSGKAPLEIKLSSKKPGELNPADKSQDEAWRFAASSDTPYIYRISKAQADSLMKNADDFYDRAAPFKLAQSKVHAIEVIKGGLDLKIKKADQSWTLSEPFAGHELDSAKVDDLLGRISVLDADRILSKTKAEGVKEGENQIVLKDEEGLKLLQINWGSGVTENGENGQKTKYYYVKTDKSERALLLKDSKIDELPIAALLKSKEVQK
jgi:hypothetical protein